MYLRVFFARTRRHIATALTIVLLVGAFVGAPSMANGDCVSRQPSLWIVILFWECNSSFNASANRIDAVVHQEYGAPWCYIYDRLSVYRLENGVYTWKTTNTWENWQSVDSFNHFGVHRAISRTYSYGGSYKVYGRSYRISNHNQLFYAGKTAFAHTPDTHTKNMYGGL